MHWFISYIVAHKHGSSLFVTVVLSILMLNASSEQQEKLSHRLMHSIFYPVLKVTSTTTDFHDVYQRNDELSEKVTMLTQENEKLRKEIERIDETFTTQRLSEDLNYDLISSTVVGREPSPFFNSIVLDAGEEHGVQPNMPVISSFGLVGKVTQVLSKSSLVQLIRNPDIYVSVHHRQSDAVGILTSNGANKISVSLRNHYSVSMGDTLYTSGMGGVYPAGLPIGTVKKSESGDIHLYNDITIKPFVDFGKLRYVHILKLESRWTSIHEEIDSLLEEVE